MCRLLIEAVKDASSSLPDDTHAACFLVSAVECSLLPSESARQQQMHSCEPVPPGFHFHAAAPSMHQEQMEEQNSLQLTSAKVHSEQIAKSCRLKEVLCENKYSKPVVCNLFES